MPDGPHLPADITYTQQMYAHHRISMILAGQGTRRASRAAVKKVAAGIIAEQQLELDAMAGWLRGWLPAADPNRGPRPAGMITARQLAQLHAATGPAFDRLFLH